MWERQWSDKMWSPDQVSWLVGLTSGHHVPNLWPEHYLNPPINTPVIPLAESVKKVRFSPL
jgi:hypothetical protein